MDTRIGRHEKSLPLSCWLTSPAPLPPPCLGSTDTRKCLSVCLPVSVCLSPSVTVSAYVSLLLLLLRRVLKEVSPCVSLDLVICFCVSVFLLGCLFVCVSCVSVSVPAVGCVSVYLLCVFICLSLFLSFSSLTVLNSIFSLVFFTYFLSRFIFYLI